MTSAAFMAVLAGSLAGPLAAGTQVDRAYAGVACRAPNSIACDRLGIAVELRPRPARASAFFGSRRVTLARLGGGETWTGYLSDAAIDWMLLANGTVTCGPRWYGRTGRVPLIAARIVVAFRDGHRETLPVLTPLRPGWG